jgi:hypothetical protein
MSYDRPSSFLIGLERLRVKNKCRQRLIVDLSAKAPEKMAFGYGSDAPIFRQLVRLIVTVELLLDPCSEAFVSLQGGDQDRIPIA